MQPPEVEAIRDELGRLYAQVQQVQIAELEAIGNDPTQFRRRARLVEQGRAVIQALDEVDIQARVWASTRLPEVYQIGAMEAAQATGKPYTWTAIHREAVGEIASDTYGDLLSATQFVRRDVKAYIRMAARQRAAEAVIGGRTATDAGRRLARDLAERHIAAIRYKNGARHTLGDFADVLLRTQTAKAYNFGTLNHGVASGVRWFYVTDGLGCGWSFHNSSDLAAGTVRKAEECQANYISHPRCARGFSPAPQVKTAKEAEAARQYAPEEQARLATEERARAEVRTVTGRLTQRERQRQQAARGRATRLRQREARLAARARRVRR